ncbi:oligosaccharide flippase family protein [Larkinella insperata]|uniref:Oligosaccharide flippase family protein n=1 Tax=Larkinella insperata TaxID=332158 RepID=A0ABW3QFB3_9BACT|nr:oligosaccharide flippase family protein [Larkinella insperata]
MLIGSLNKVSSAYATPVKLIALTGVSVVVTLYINYLLADQVSPEKYGTWRLFLTITSFSGLFHFGLTDGITIQWLFKDGTDWQKSAKRDFSYLVIQQVCVYTVIVVVGGSGIYPQVYQTNPAVLVANQIALQNLSGLLQSLFNRHHKFYYGPLLTLFSQVVFLVGLTACKTGYMKSLDLILLSNIQIAVTVLLMVYLASKKAKGWPAIQPEDFYLTNILRKTKEFISLGLPILLVGLLFLGFQNIDKLLIAGFYPARQFGFYAFAATLLNVCLTVVSSVANFMMQKLAPYRHSLELYYDKAVFSILLLIPFLFFSVTPLQFLVQTFLPAYSASTVYVRYLSGFIGPYLLVQLIQFSVFKLLNKQRVFLILATVFFVLSLSVEYLLALTKVPLVMIALSSVLLAYGWFAVGDWLLCTIKPECKLKQKKRYFFMVATICLYLLINFIAIE